MTEPDEQKHRRGEGELRFELSRAIVPLLPFCVVSTSIIDDKGIKWTIESRAFGKTVRKINALNIQWDEIDKVEFDNMGPRPGVRIYPKDPERFKYKISSFPIRMRPNTFERGSVRITYTTMDRASQAYEKCMNFLKQNSP